MGYMATDVFGADPTAIQPSPTATPEHLGRPEPMARTMGPENDKGMNSPALVLVAMLGLAVVILHLISKG